MVRALALAVVVAWTSPAHALKPAVHAEVTTTSCRAAGLGANLCARIATEDYNTDAREWTDLRAHAQIEAGQTACTAADATAARLFGLGSDLRAALADVSASVSEDRVGKVDALIGRALHTIQDDCAHHGMPNPQHAWFSLGDYCDGTETSPDLDPAALACAKTETAAVMTAVAAAIRNAGLATRLDGYSCPEVATNGDHGGSTQTVCQQRALPGPFDACEFLGEAKDWDGIDRTWNNTLVVPALRGAFTAGLSSAHAPAAICGGNEARIANPVSKSIVDIADRPHCAKASLFCLGKADDTDNPFADDPASQDVGCNAGGGSGFGLVLLVAIAASRRRSTRKVRSCGSRSPCRASS